MKCPTCKSISLTPSKIEPGLPAMGCTKCGGAFLSLLYYRYWIEHHPAENLEHIEAEIDTQGEDSHTALNCPKCGRLMTKYRISGDIGNRLDLCASCDEAWLDGGEWTLLKTLEISHQLPAIFTEPWQHKVRRESTEGERRTRYRKILGEEDLQEAERIHKWIRKHAKRQDILNYISHE